MPLWVFLLLLYFVFAFLQIVFFLTQAFCALEDSNSKTKTRIELVYFSFLIYIIGLWVLQPKIKRLANT
jgi:hypothetical protein